MNFTDYELGARNEIDDFKNPEVGLFRKAIDTANKPLEKLGDYALDNEIGDAVSSAMKGIVDILNDGSSYTVRTNAICRRYERHGYEGIDKPTDIQDLSLADIEKVVGYLSTKYKSAAFAEGGVAGVAGAAGIAADIPSLLAISLRAVNEYATYYGFDINVEQERAIALNVLLAASSTTQVSKQAALSELTKVSVKVAQRKTWKELEKYLSVRAIKKIAEKLGIRLTKAKLAQVVPVVGAAIGGGFNAWYVSAVTKTARMTFRERYMIRKYGPDAAIEVR